MAGERGKAGVQRRIRCRRRLRHRSRDAFDESRSAGQCRLDALRRYGRTRPGQIIRSRFQIVCPGQKAPQLEIETRVASCQPIELAVHSLVVILAIFPVRSMMKACAA